MIKIEKVDVVGWEHAIRGMRNSWNSWEKSDSFECDDDDCQKGLCPYFTVDGENSEYAECNKYDLHMSNFIVGKNDLDLMKKLCKAGSDERKFMRMIVVYADITAPMYWWKEADTYKVGTVRNSCSTMHSITENEFTPDDFSYEHLIENPDLFKVDEISIPDSDGYKLYSPKDILTEWIIPSLNACREEYLKTKDKKYWWQIIQLLPSSYNQKSTVMLNYEVLANMYNSRKNHRLDEWKTFCAWIETLPYSELITGRE
jgi:hypothetical protein